MPAPSTTSPVIGSRSGDRRGPPGQAEERRRQSEWPRDLRFHRAARSRKPYQICSRIL
uniref:Uncharacterized protein n=1 Tax=Oryza sativa subsp. japonica TaxID=39947 RepID=Q5VSC3_ORYSJ|nr:unknown protein [Oryza sativa Japonica Group]